VWRLCKEKITPLIDEPDFIQSAVNHLPQGDFEGETFSKWMNELKVRHLPVREAGKIVGIVSDRDLGLMAEMSASGKGDHDCKIEDAMVSAVLTVFESQTVKEVTEKMLAHRVGSAVVTDKTGSVTGIFTDTDALKILSGTN
jgi:predicted transcriptional regulator